jgi:hypothetical protein
MSWKDFTSKYGDYKENSFLTYPMRRVWRIISAKERPYLTGNIANYVNEIPTNVNVELKEKALFAKKDIPKGEELSLQYPVDYNRYWLGVDKKKPSIQGDGLLRNERMDIVKEIYNISKEDAVADFEKLRQINCDDFDKVKMGSRVGANFVDYFTALPRMETKGDKGISFFEMLDDRKALLEKNYIKKMIKYYKDTQPDYPLIKVWWRIFNVYYGSINQFKALIAMGVYCKYKPKSVLDFTMGWGGRLVGACALNIPKYTGVDLNPDLERPYEQMVSTLKPMTTTQIKLIFKDALKVDYSKIDYDLVLTSPPYYNIELYKGTDKRDKETWDKEFYEPLFIKTWKHLKRGGHYCLNVPAEVYERVCVKVLGKADEFLPLYKSKRTKDEKYKEYIYVWVKRRLSLQFV